MSPLAISDLIRRPVIGVPGGSSPMEATYVTIINDAGLANERAITAGSGIALTDGGAGSTITISIAPGSKLAVVIKTSAYPATTSDDVIVCNSTTAFTITLPAATGSGQVYHIKNINTGTVTISKAGDTIDGETSQLIAQWVAVMLVDYAANKWAII